VPPWVCIALAAFNRIAGDLRKGVDFSDPKLPKMTMTTFDGAPYIEQYTLSKLQVLPDFGTENKAAPTPVRPSFLCASLLLASCWTAAACSNTFCCIVYSPTVCLRLCLCLRALVLTHAAGPPRILEGLQAVERGQWNAAVKLRV
jgi:hypothetical protein